MTITEWPGTLFDGGIRRLADLRATPDTTPGTELTAQDHARCPGHAAFLEARGSWHPPAERVAAGQLDSQQVQDLIAGYAAGATVYQLGGQFGYRPADGGQDPPQP